VDVEKVAAPVDILAVDDLRLLRMQHPLAGRQAVGNRAPQCPRLVGGNDKSLRPLSASLLGRFATAKKTDEPYVDVLFVPLRRRTRAARDTDDIARAVASE